MSAGTQPRTEQRIARLRLQRVLHDFGETLAVAVLDDNSFRVASPFSFVNGEMFPVVVETRGSGWRLTDRGDTIATLTRIHGQLDHRDVDVIVSLAHANGFTVSAAYHLSADFDDLPSPGAI